jgi:hypothetical protein
MTTDDIAAITQIARTLIAAFAELRKWLKRDRRRPRRRGRE